MNIQKLISQVRAAKKRRLINNFHCSPKGGVDVSDEDFQSLLLLLKDMFKSFKAHKCSIKVSFYGEIYITLIELGHSFELSIANRPLCADIKYADTHLEGNQFLKLNSSNFDNSLTVSFKTLRKTSEWKHYNLSDVELHGRELAELITKEMHQRAKYYSSNDEVLILDQTTKEDMFAAIHLGGAILGKSSMLYHLSKYIRSKIYISKISISENDIIMSDTFDRECNTHFFGDREAKFFSQYLINY
ncbi:hypothetical protein ESZ36_08515 [Colwellia demingiae]|uniref:Uncharacterized protein n=1 Tax=Colwellia demingiae TaxID=89401 RepID=A0A5C6QIN9_9GAMM|nr:hypothetical protein [Colwellia demingiae]TWX68527.1 hypothetical protein ESZ36_08515 [Colwellia demingiae]